MRKKEVFRNKTLQRLFSLLLKLQNKDEKKVFRMFCALGSIHEIVEGRSQARRAGGLFFTLVLFYKHQGLN